MSKNKPITLMSKVKTVSLIGTSAVVVYTGLLVSAQFKESQSLPPQVSSVKLTPVPTSATPPVGSTIVGSLAAPQAPASTVESKPLLATDPERQAWKGLPRQYCGKKLLVAFHHYTATAIDHYPTITDKQTEDAEYLAGYQALGQTVRDEIAKAGLNFVEVVSEPPGPQLHETGLHYDALMLVDCRGKTPEAALKELSDSVGAIVFRDGNYLRGLPGPDKSFAFAGTPMAYTGLGLRGDQNSDVFLSRWSNLPYVTVEFIAPPPPS